MSIVELGWADLAFMWVRSGESLIFFKMNLVWIVNPKKTFWEAYFLTLNVIPKITLILRKKLSYMNSKFQLIYLLTTIHFTSIPCLKLMIQS